MQFIIDPKFREQFLIAHPTARYSAMLEALPEVFTGTDSQLAGVVEVLCAELSRAFKINGDILPPWRQFTSMISKWRPRRSMEEVVRASSQAPSICKNKFQRSVRASKAFEPYHVYMGGNFVPAA